MPGLRSEIKFRGGVGGVLQVAPGAAGSVIKSGGGHGKVFARLVGSEQPAAGGQHGAEIIREAFVNPQQIVLHGLLIVRSGEIGGAAVFSVPRMHVLVRKQAGFHFASGFIDQSALVDPAVIGFVMLEAEVRDVIAQAEQEVVVAIVMRAEKLVRLIDQILVVVPDFLRRVESGGAVGGNIHLGERIVG